ncbi:MAG: flippase-like domain-containing protein [Chitinispirillaceae bacterium]|nr:flippase-like domain-containing protein [Chitinispirillaceae bacterium]
MIKIPKPILTVCKFAFAAVPFIWIFSRVEIDRFIPTIVDVKWWTIPILFMSVIVAMLLQGTRWWLLLRAFSPGLTLRSAMGCHFRSLYYSLLLPNTTAQEIVRTVFMAKRIGKVTSWSAAWICKITGLMVSVGLSIYGLTVLSKVADSAYFMRIILISAMAMVLLIVFSFSKKVTRPLRHILLRLIPESIVGKVEKMREGIYQYRYKKRYVFWAGLITLFAQLSIFGGASMTIKGITGSSYFLECIAFIPLIEMISMAQPFTPNGIGVRDALFALMFARLHLSKEQLCIYIVISNLSIFLKLLGALPIIHDFMRKKKRIE